MVPKKKIAKSSELQKAAQSLRKVALTYPETREDHPWGECAFKVKDKVFLFMNESDSKLGLGVKLPRSSREALKKDFAEPTHYGLGRHGWVTFTFTAGDKIPLSELTEWLDESFCAMAPKKIVAAFKSTM